MELLYRDEEVAIFDKPSGLLTHSSAMAREPDTALTRARDALGAYVWPLHRLDRGTSGVLAFALTQDSARAIGAAFDDGVVFKAYLAIVRGSAPETATIDHPIPKCEGGERVDAVTEIERVATGARASLVLARPRTGRFHQVRRHLKHIGNPIACDSNYGTGWFNRWMREEIGIGRLALHATAIDLPLRGGRVTVRARLPGDMARALERLGIEPPRA